MSIKNIV